MSEPLGNDMDQPFHRMPRQELQDAVTYVGGVQVAAGVADLPMLGKRPIIVFRFAHADGTMHEPLVLVADDDQIAKLVPLITQACNAARREAGK